MSNSPRSTVLTSSTTRSGQPRHRKYTVLAQRRSTPTVDQGPATTGHRTHSPTHPCTYLASIGVGSGHLEYVCAAP